MASVLIIDDHKGTIETYSIILRLSGFEAATASTGKGGIDLARSRNLDVIIVDRRLPDMDGIDVLRELKLNRVTGRIVVVTAFPTLESAFDAAAVGADGYVDGPLFGDEIVEVVNQALNGPFPVQHPRRAGKSNQLGEQERGVESPSAIDPRVREVMRMINSDVANSRTVGELAGHVGLSESRLGHLFHTQVGLSVTEFRIERRLRSAAEQLSMTFEDVRQIAYRLGFRSASLRDFRMRFGKRFGMSPTAYRARFSRGGRST